MAYDEIAHNSYFHLLQDKFRSKYEKARSHNWLICIPMLEALRGIDIDEHFIDLHMLQPFLGSDVLSLYCSTDEHKSLVFQLDGSRLHLQCNGLKNCEPYIVKILSEEIGYNVKFQPYKLLILDKLLSPSIAANSAEIEDCPINLNDKITCTIEARQFLVSCTKHAENALSQLDSSLGELSQEIQQSESLETICAMLRHAVRSQWSVLLTIHPLHRQRDARFQFLLSMALENFVVSSVHQEVFAIMVSQFVDQDFEVHSKSTELSRLGISPDQLGAPEDLAVQLPAAVVELAALDNLQCPIEKLMCLKACLDLILAQVKGALVDFYSISDEGSGLPPVASEDLISLLVAVLIQAKPLHLVSNIFYMEHLQWTLPPNDCLSYSLVTFKAALKKLLNIKVEELRPRSKKVRRELTLEDLFLVTGEIEQPDRKVTSPLDRELESIAAMIEASTKDMQSSF